MSVFPKYKPDDSAETKMAACIQHELDHGRNAFGCAASIVRDMKWGRIAVCLLNPIATIPTDGTIVLVTDGNNWSDANQPPGHKLGKWRWHAETRQWLGGQLPFQPTHWMPLPETGRMSDDTGDETCRELVEMLKARIILLRIELRDALMMAYGAKENWPKYAANLLEMRE